ncbi:MAG: hypothetical protein EZS28_042780 [Streblomastix strix]|uniref:Uncharacterized protein n=1 Tax=Streblomastix strix TaxID=222440 RepID=A0A5J4TUX1_9EUKA|nr:MAG: hypothetical protein EZS28_042780 [Streblomastix strix]
MLLCPILYAEFALGGGGVVVVIDCIAVINRTVDTVVGNSMDYSIAQDFLGDQTARGFCVVMNLIVEELYDDYESY